MKVIFLDIDGVLNSNDWYVKTRGIGGYNGGDVDPKCIELINDLIDATGAKIIMSSSWRSDYENSCEYLYDNGLYCDAIIGKTPHFCYTCQNDIAEEFGYDPDDMEDEDWDKLWEQTSEGDYYHYTIEEFEGDDEEWEEYDGEIYGKGE